MQRTLALTVLIVVILCGCARDYRYDGKVVTNVFDELQQYSNRDLESLSTNEVSYLNLLLDRIRHRYIRPAFVGQLNDAFGRTFWAVIEIDDTDVKLHLRISIIENGEFYSERRPTSFTLEAARVDHFEVMKGIKGVGDVIVLTINSANGFVYKGQEVREYLALGSNQRDFPRIKLIRQENASGLMTQLFLPCEYDSPRRDYDLDVLVQENLEVEILAELMWLTSAPSAHIGIPDVRSEKINPDDLRKLLFLDEERKKIGADVLQKLLHHKNKWIREAAELFAKQSKESDKSTPQPASPQSP